MIKQFRGIIIVLSASLAFLSCGHDSFLYVDIQKQAIISCDGNWSHYVSIESEYDEVILEGAPPVILFNKTGDAVKMFYNGAGVDNHVLTLRPNCDYTVSKSNGFDRGPLRISFKTDSLCRIVTASDTICP